MKIIYGYIMVKYIIKQNYTGVAWLFSVRVAEMFGSVQKRTKLLHYVV